MTKIQADMCDCCKEIWNKNNLKDVKVGEHILHFCSDCFTEYIKPLDKISAEIQTMADDEWNIQVGASKGLEVALEVIDKYREGENE